MLKSSMGTKFGRNEKLLLKTSFATSSLMNKSFGFSANEEISTNFSTVHFPISILFSMSAPGISSGV